MKSIRFVSNHAHQKQFANAVRKNVNEYFREKGISKKGNFSMYLQTFLMLAFYIAPFVLLLTVSMNIWLSILMVISMGIGVAGVGMAVMHDAAHGSYSDKEWVNKLLAGTMHLLGGGVINWKIQHNMLHHTYTNIDGYDEDIASRGPLRMSESAPVKKIHHYQYFLAFFFYGLLTLSKLVGDFAQLKLYNKEGLTRQQNINPNTETIKLIFVKVAYLLLFIGLPILITPFLWWQVLIGFFIMHWIAGCILSTVFQMAHVVQGAEQPMPNSDGVINDEWAVHELKTTSDFARNNHFLNWYVGGLNFQIEHHLFPNICHVHYQKIAPIVERTAREYGYNYNLKPSFGTAFMSHVNRLKELGR